MITSSVITWKFYQTKTMTTVQKINPNFIQKIVLKQIKYPLILRIIYNYNKYQIVNLQRDNYNNTFFIYSHRKYVTYVYCSQFIYVCICFCALIGIVYVFYLWQYIVFTLTYYPRYIRYYTIFLNVTSS